MSEVRAVLETRDIQSLKLSQLSYDDSNAMYQAVEDEVFRRIYDLTFWDIGSKNAAKARSIVDGMRSVNVLMLSMMARSSGSLEAVISASLSTYDLASNDVVNAYCAEREQ